jgi:hypothetical protein
MRKRTIPNGVRVNLEFYTRHELLTFRTWCFLRKKSMREMTLEWLEKDMASHPRLVKSLDLILAEMED